MKNTARRSREGSVSDIHITRRDCASCDGSGHLFGERVDLWSLVLECPECEGLGYLDSPESELAYQAYLFDLYADVVRGMPAPQSPPERRRTVAA